MQNKIKVLLLYLAFPLAMGTYFRRALERRTDIDLKVTGVYTGAWIPWLGGMEVPKKYAIPIDLPLPFAPNIGEVNYELVKAQLGDWKPDLIINVDAGIHWKYKPVDGTVVTVGTDPHVLNYDTPRSYSDRFFNMQRCYSKDRDIYLPYAYDPTVHYKMPEVNKDADAVLGGMPYQNRVEWVNALRAKGVSVLFENGPIFDEYREMNNHAMIGLNWSSMNDLNARAFELPAMGLAPVMNTVPDMHEFMGADYHYFEFRNLSEAVEKVLWLKEHPIECADLAQRAYENILPHTYDDRIQQIFTESGF
jgi:hypothetical protein